MPFNNTITVSSLSCLPAFERIMILDKMNYLMLLGFLKRSKICVIHTQVKNVTNSFINRFFFCKKLRTAVAEIKINVVI